MQMSFADAPQSEAFFNSLKFCIDEKTTAEITELMLGFSQGRYQLFQLLAKRLADIKGLREGDIALAEADFRSRWHMCKTKRDSAKQVQGDVVMLLTATVTQFKTPGPLLISSSLTQCLAFASVVLEGIAVTTSLRTGVSVIQNDFVLSAT